jgi:hypothetical protein
MRWVLDEVGLMKDGESQKYRSGQSEMGKVWLGGLIKMDE